MTDHTQDPYGTPASIRRMQIADAAVAALQAMGADVYSAAYDLEVQHGPVVRLTEGQR